MKKTKISQSYKHGFIGIGKMAQILLSNLLKQKNLCPSDVLVSRSNPMALKKVGQEFKVHTTPDNVEVAIKCQHVWLGIKPFQAKEVLEEIAAPLKQSPLISMLAGLSTQSLQKFLGKSHPVVRVMPNTPALLGKGMTGIYFSSKVSKSFQEVMKKILQSAGEILVLKKEKDFDALTGLSGSGPAFIYYLAEALITGGIASGLKKSAAKKLALQTLVGASAMLQQSQTPPEKLIAQVVSKGGTTEAGLKILAKKHVDKAISQAVQQAAKRSQDISRSF